MKLNPSRLAWTFAVVTFVVGATATSIGASSVQSGETESKSEVTTSAADACLSDPVVLNEITKKRQELENKQKELQTKETELKARETALNDELKKLQDLRDEVAKMDTAHRQANQEKVAKVIETLQSMSPKASAQFLTSLDDDLAVSAISQMDTAKLAKIMNTIDPKRGSKLTELMAGVVRAHNSSQAAEPAGRSLASSGATETIDSPQAKKGGKTNDSTNKQPESIISGGPTLSKGN